MARYRKIDPRIWKDENFLKLSSQEKLITIYGFTAQSNRIGLFSFSPGEAAEDLQTLPQTFAKGFEKVTKTLSWGWDSGVRVLYIPTWWKYNCPENPNVLKACLADIHEIPTTYLLSKFCDNLIYLPETFHETFLKGLPKPSIKPSPNQEQEQEQDKEQEQERERGAAAPPPGQLQLGEFKRVVLTEDQHTKLLSKLNGSLDAYIARFDRWVNEAPDAKKNGIRRRDRHAYESILAWYDRDVSEGKIKKPTERKAVY